MLTGKADVLLLASSDRDFSHLATHLRESGRRVVGVGEDGKASGHFLRCCSAHHLLKVAEPAVAPAPAPVPAVAATPAPNAPEKVAPHVAALIALIRGAGTGGALPIQQLGGKAKAATGKTPAELGHASWRAVLTAHPRHFRCDPKGPAAQVRLV